MRTTKNRAPFLLVLACIPATVCLLSAGCGQNSVKLTSAEKQAFAQASPEVKQLWERALTADKANDYTNAVTLLGTLGEMQLNEAQTQALYKERESFNQRLWHAAEKNDPAAVKAVQLSQRDRRGTPAAPPQ